MSHFVTDSGIVVPAVTEAQMRELDRIAIEETGPNLFQMMENAGRGLAELALERLGAGWRAATVLVLAGPGGNGGGGLCAARHLANHGVRVRVCLSAPDRLAEVPAFQRHVLAGTNAEEVAFDGLGAPDLILDALLGYSLRGPPRGRGGKAHRVGQQSGRLDPVPRFAVWGRRHDGRRAGRFRSGIGHAHARAPEDRPRGAPGARRCG